ncbi:Frataxin, partial [Neoconidiobolus thromboides FSU 785]
FSELTAERYYKVSEQSLSNLLDQLEELIQEEGDDTFDLEYSSGVLTLKLGNLGTYVINKQPPNKQIWLSSPISGPKRYDFDTKSNLWFYSRDGESLDSILSKELSQLLGVKVELEL